METTKRTGTIANGTRSTKDENSTLRRDRNESTMPTIPGTQSQTSSNPPDLMNSQRYVETSPKHQNRTPTAKYIAEFHPLSYLFTIVRGNLKDDSDSDGKPRLPSAVLGVLNRMMIREYNAKISKLNREIDDIQKRIDGIHEKVNSLNRERRDPDSTSTSDRNFGNEIYLLVRNVGMWMRRMETKAKLIEKIEWSIYILEALQEIDENCNATIFWSYTSWRKTQYLLGPGGADSDWDNSNEYTETKYDKYDSDTPEIIRLFNDYESAYRRNIEVAKLIKDSLARSSDERLSRYIQDNYIDCKGCKATFSRRYDDLFGTRIRCPSRKLAIANLLTKGTTGEENGSHLIMHFFCTDCFDAFNPSILKKMKRDEEKKAEKDLEALIEEHQQEQERTKNMSGNNNNKSSKKRKKKKKKKGKKNNSGTAIVSNITANGTNGTNHSTTAKDAVSGEKQQSDNDHGVDDDDNVGSQKSCDVLDEKENDDTNCFPCQPETAGDYENIDSSMNDVFVDYLWRTGSIIELNAFMDKTIGVEADLP